MTDQPFPENPVTTVVNPVIDGIFSVAVKLAQDSLAVLDPPITMNPIIKFIDDEAIKWIAEQIYKQFALMVGFTIIDVQVSGQVSDFKKALAALKAAQLKGDPNAIQVALANFQMAASHLTVINGAATP